MKLKRFLLRYYPPGKRRKSLLVLHQILQKYLFPGVILEYELRDKSIQQKEIDLLHLTAEYVFYTDYWFFNFF
jgi:hypothetical protein